jgi:hypothetical protein
LSFWPGRKLTTRRALIGISSPVFGLRPGRSFFSRSSKTPEPGRFDFLAAPQHRADSLEEALDQVFGLPFVEPELGSPQNSDISVREGVSLSRTWTYSTRTAAVAKSSCQWTGYPNRFLQRCEPLFQ